MRTIALACALLLAGCMTTSEPATSDIRFAVEGYDRTHSATLGLGAVPGAETVTVFAPAVDTDNAYNHGAVLTVFRGRYLVQWQSSARDEDADDTRVMMATSTDGRTWTAPRVLVGPRSGAVVTNGGWLSDGETLTAFVNVWPEAPAGPRQGFTEALTSRDGDDWTAPVPVRNASGAPVAGIIEQDPRPLPDGRILTAFHLQPGLVATPHYTTDPLGLTGWTAARFENLPTDGPVSRELEPSWYLAQDGAVVMVFRDQAGTFSTLVSESGDLGRSWSRPALAAFPDSRSKQSAGNLPDGTAFRVNTPRRDARRYPLVLSLSEDGRLFDRAFALRTGLADLPPMRFDGRYKRLGYSYPKSLVHDGWLYVAYATNKERIEITRVPLDSLAGKGEAVSPAPR